MIALTALITFAACNEPTPPETDITTPNVAYTTPSEETTTLPAEVTTTPSENTPVPEVLDKSKTYNILFVGNSYTYYNDMPENYFKKIMEAAGYTVNVKSITKGSQFLIDSANASNEVGAKVDAALKNEKYDFVIIQGQSLCPIKTPSKFYNGVRAMYEKIKTNGATPILYNTWGRKTGHSFLTEYNLTNESMTWKLAAAYEKIGAELDIEVAYVGLAYFDVYTNNPSIELYTEDLLHPTPTGSLLAAFTIFSKITGVDPTTVEYSAFLEHFQSRSAIIKEAARKAVFETPEIPAEYK